MASHAQPLSADALPRAVGAQRGLRVCHIVSGDLWAGAEVQVATVASYLVERATLWWFADLIIAVSKRMAETLKDSGYAPTPVTHIHNGVDPRKVRATRTGDAVRRELGIGPRALLVGTAGRLSHVKGHRYFLRAAQRILETEGDARFLIVGDGPLRHELLASAAHLRVEGACLLLGPRTDIYDLIAAMDIFVLPSLDEGIPMVILEAMALGTPVVATAVGGVPEVIRHRETGLLVAPRDERALAEACLELADRKSVV